MGAERLREARLARFGYFPDDYDEREEVYYEDYNDDYNYQEWSVSQHESTEFGVHAPQTKTIHTDANRQWRDTRQIREHFNARKHEKRMQGRARQCRRDQEQQIGKCGLALLGAALEKKT